MGKWFFMLIVCLTFCFCNQQEQRDESTVQNGDVVKAMKNESADTEKVLELDVKKVLTIDPSYLENGDTILFSNAVKDPQNNLYILDDENKRIYKFNDKGEFLLSFLKRGEGPGEFIDYPDLQFTHGSLWVLGHRKIVRFSPEGKMLNEIKFKNYFYWIRILDESRFLAPAEHFFDKNNGTKFTKKIAIFSLKNQSLITSLIEHENMGRLFIKVGLHPISVFPSPGNIPDLIACLDQQGKRIFLCKNDEYEIQVKDYKNQLLRTFYRIHQNVAMAAADKLRIVEKFRGIPDNIKKLIQKSLPRTFCAIRKISILPSGHLLVSRVTGYNTEALDLFSQEGEMIGQIKLNFDHKPKVLKFFNGVVGILQELDNKTVYHEFLIQSHQQFFRKH